MIFVCSSQETKEIVDNTLHRKAKKIKSKTNGCGDSGAPDNMDIQHYRSLKSKWGGFSMMNKFNKTRLKARWE